MDNEEPGCNAIAEWSIWTGPRPDDCTEACSAHVGELLITGTNTIYPVEDHGQVPPKCCYIPEGE